MKAILLAAGLGTRLRPLTNTTPKCLVKINGKPLLKIWLDMLFESNIDRVLINTHHLSELVEEFVYKSGFKERVELRYEKTLLGTAATLFACQKFIGNEPIIVIHADNLSKFNINQFIKAHQNRPKNCNMTMMLFRTDVPENCGVVELNEFGVVVRFYEKSLNPPSNIANAAVYILEAELLIESHSIDPNMTDFSTHIIPRNLGKIFTYLNEIYHRDIGTYEGLRLGNIEYPKIS